jgi:hypothetical protein
MRNSIQAGFILLAASCLRAADQPPADAGLPQPFDSESANALLVNSPFTRIVSLKDTLQLTGVAYVEGKPVATFLNKATKERILVSEEPNELGWRITEATPSTALQNTEVHVMIGPEMVIMHYGDTQLMPAKRGSSSGSSSRRMSGPGGDTPKTSSYLGENGRELYMSLSPEGRIKLKGIIQSHAERHPEESMEETSALAQKIYAKIKAGDQKSSSSSTSSPGDNPSSKSYRGKMSKRGRSSSQ